MFKYNQQNSIKNHIILKNDNTGFALRRKRSPPRLVEQA